MTRPCALRIHTRSAHGLVISQCARSGHFDLSAGHLSPNEVVRKTAKRVERSHGLCHWVMFWQSHAGRGDGCSHASNTAADLRDLRFSASKCLDIFVHQASETVPVPGTGSTPTLEACPCPGTVSIPTIKPVPVQPVPTCQRLKDYDQRPASHKSLVKGQKWGETLFYRWWY